MNSSNSMRCAVWIGGREFRIEERPVPEVGAGHVRVRVQTCGVCLTDVHHIEGYFGPTNPPRVLGHEFAGRIEAIGPEVGGLEVGMTVACWGSGGFAEQAVIPVDRVFPIPDGVPFEHAAFIEPIACCLAAVTRARLPVGCLALITGAGPMGLLTLQLARRSGAARVFVSEPNPVRRAMAAQLGADEVIDPTAVPVSEAVARFTDGAGVDAGFEAAGQPVPLADCLNAVVDGGTVVMVGVPPASAHLDIELYRFHRRNLTLTGSYGAAGRGAFRSAVSWLGQLDLDPLISHRFPLEEIATAFEIARNGVGLKVLVQTG